MRYLITLCLVLAAMVPSARATLILSSNATIDAPVFDTVQVVDGPNPPTVVDMLDGGYIYGHLGVLGHSVFNLRGGQVDDDVAANDSATLNIFGGLIGPSDIDVAAYGSSVINVYGGMLGDDLAAVQSGTVNLYGGSFLKAGDGAGLVVQNDGVINVYLRHFNVLPPPPAYEIYDCCGFLVGTLSDGAEINVFLFVDPSYPGSRRIALHTVPEPASDVDVIALVTALIVYAARRCERRSRCRQPFSSHK
jgi:hypothetical protein